jgi:ParB-like chromosome segregation protein Spo0J
MEQVKLADLKPLEKNPRKHSTLQIQELKRSVKMFGQIRPLVIDEDNNVLAGNGLLMSLIEMGWNQADVLRLTGLSEFSKKRLILADNKLSALGTDDYSVIEELIFDLRDELDIPGFDDQILKSLVAPPQQLEEIGKSYGTVTESFREQVEAQKEKVKAETKAMQDQVEESNPKTPYTTCESCGQKVWS